MEGSGSYGSGACAHLGAAREQVIEFSHPRTAATSDGAKTDALDARRAAREVLGRPDLAVPRARGRREALRALESTRRGAQTARTAAINELKALIVSAPVGLARPAPRPHHRRPGRQMRRVAPAGSPPRRAHRHQTGPAQPRPADQDPHRGRPPTCKRASAGSSKPSPRTCSTSPASGPSPPRSSTSPGHTPADGATKQPSPASPASPHSKHPPGKTPATASTAAATANSTARCTPSPSPAAATAPTPRPTSPNEPPKAKPPEKPNAASNATSPARSTASSNTPKSTLDKHRSIEYAKGPNFKRLQLLLLRSICRFLPRTVDLQTTLNCPAPSPRAPLQGPHRYYGPVRPCAPHRYSPTRSVCCLWFSPSRPATPAVSIGATGSLVPCQRLRRAHATYTPDTAGATYRQLPD